MKTVQLLVLVIMLMFTAGMYAQTQYTYQQPETVLDAVQNQRLAQVEGTVAKASADIDKLTVELAGLRSSIDRFTGIGIGLGTALTALQGLLVIITYRRK